MTETYANGVQFNRAYDSMGRVDASTQYTGGQTFSMSYGYNLASDLTSVTPPTTRVQKTSYDSANRISQVQDTYGGTTLTHASGFTYFPNRVVQTMTLGHINGAERIGGEHLAGYVGAVADHLAKFADWRALPDQPWVHVWNGCEEQRESDGGSITTWNPNGVAGINVTQAFGYDAYDRISTAAEAHWLFRHRRGTEGRRVDGG